MLSQGQRIDRPDPSNEQKARETERQLVERCLAGDLEAFRGIYEQHAARLFSLAFRIVGSAADAEELLQETFLLAYRKLGSFKGESSLGTWLYRLSTNLCLDYLRSRQGKAAHLSDPLDDEVETLGVTSRDLPDPIARMDLERAIAALPPRCRAALLLYDVEGFDHREVAAILGIAEGTSKSLVHKARLRVRAWLGGTR